MLKATPRVKTMSTAATLLVTNLLDCEERIPGWIVPRPSKSGQQVVIFGGHKMKPRTVADPSRGSLVGPMHHKPAKA